MASQISPSPPSPKARSFATAPLLPTPTSPASRPPARSPQTTPKATHICDQCSRAFSRAEHLERHQTTHLPSNATKSFVCVSCGKGFTRKDVLTRHVRAVHETKKSDVRKSRRKSCRRCANFKIKCTGGGKGKESGEKAEEPCEACKKRDADCIYDFGVTVERNESQESNHPDDLLDFGSDDVRSEAETGSSEFARKRQKIDHPSTGPPPPHPAAVSPHLLSAVRHASEDPYPGQRFESALSSKSLEIPNFLNGVPYERPPEPPRSMQADFARIMNPPQDDGGNYQPTFYFPPMRNTRTIADEELSAASALQGIIRSPSHSFTLSGSKNGVDKIPGALQQSAPTAFMAEPTAPETHEDESSSFFNFGTWENSTDWLRDWGPNESPESMEGGDHLQDVGLAAALTPAPAEPGAPSNATSSREHISPPAPSDSGNPEDHAAVSPLREPGDFLPWKSDAPKEEPGRKVTLPPLRSLLEYGDQDPRRDGMTDEMRREMVNLLAAPSSRPAYPGYDREELDKVFPSKEVIAGFVRLYFEQFHPILPVVHKPTFSINRCPNILLIAMVSIGASYSDVKNGKAFSDALSELCKRCLSWMADNDPGFARSPYFLQSLCLQNLYAMGSGSTALYDAADVTRSVLIGNARRIGLFSGGASPPESPPGSPIADEFESRWRQWRKNEGLKRLAWSIFEYDSSFSTLSNRRGAITLSDIKISIPCSEALWEAATAAEWVALAKEHDTRGQCFYKTLKAVMSGNFDTKTLTSWGKRICAQAMGRIMWDFKELEESVLSVSASGTGAFKSDKDKLLRSLMRVCDGSTQSAGEVENDRYHWVLSRLIAHYTHLHAAFPTISRMLNLARKPPQIGQERSDPRIKVLRSSFAQDPMLARTLAYHSAQIIALSRWRPVFSPAEGMRLFLAGVVLWGFGNYYRPPPSPQASPSSSSGYPARQEDVVRLDLLPWCLPAAGRGMTTPEEWMTTGKGKATIGMGGDCDKMMEVCGEDGAKEVLKVVVGILGSLRVWGLGGEFKAVLEELVTRRA